jgi:hypothetical protein
MPINLPTGTPARESSDLRARLRAVDPARTSGPYTPEHRRHLIDRIVAQAPAETVRPVSHRRIVVPIGAAASALLAVGLSAAAALHSGTPSAPGAAAGTEAGTEVSRRLDDIAQVASSYPRVAVGKDQFLYTRIVEAGSEMTLAADGTYRAGPLPAVSTRDTWSPQDPTRKGLIREGQTTTVINPDLGGPSSADLTFAQISALPTDPATLLHQVTGDLPAGDQEDPEHGAFTVLLGYLQQDPPPAVTGALYRAAGMIPGVTVHEDAVDALGRHGTGLVHDAKQGNIRDEYVIDEKSGAYLGSDQYLIRDGEGGRAGQHIATEALLAAGVVDRIGTRPTP